MASAHGPRAVGTDGSDHWHRESVAWQYRISSINKSRLKTCTAVQLILGLAVFIRLLPGITSLVGLSLYQKLRQWDVPAPKSWEYAWIVSLVAALLGLKSLAKNEMLLLKQYMIGTVVFGLLPVIYGMIDQIDDMYAYLYDKKYTTRIFGYPAVVVWFLFLAVALQLHGFGLYFASVLFQAWRPKPKKS
ncbi:hypothetical protein ACJMK2_029649 [Sinanodonta woodiana]|uniref:Protein jagunal n=1 Tax=Sinanodonta woodiana TaxID=1069815 RepID=A0ABD3XBC8_SINWO